MSGNQKIIGAKVTKIMSGSHENYERKSQITGAEVSEYRDGSHRL